MISRLKSIHDASDLAEWCATYYPEDSVERLECLEVAETLALNAAKDAEKDMNDDAALDRFKRIQCEKSTLSDSITVQRILTEQKGLPNILVSADFILSNINKVAHSLHHSSKFIPPEIFAENLLVVGAQKVSEVSLSDKALLTPKDFRSVASAVHKACRFLEKKYSHIDL